MDELLASIKQAIHERVAPGAPAAQAHSPSDVQRSPPARPEIGTSTGREGFAGLLGGDVRLEEALARLNKAGSRRGAEPAGAVEKVNDSAIADAAPPSAPWLRPTIDGLSGPLARQVAAGRPAPVRPAPIRPPIGMASAHRAELMPDPPADHERAATAHKDEFWEEEPIHDAPLPPERRTHISASATPGDLLSSEAASVANSAFNRLADAMASRTSGRDRSLDEITRECLRPLLKVWLDENLPGLVERLVREEIERVARPGR